MDDTQHLQKAVKLQPSEEASLLSRLFFCWAPPLFYRTYRRTTPEEYYVPLESHRSENLGDRLENAWENESLGSPNPSLWHALWKTFRWEFLALGLIFAFSEFVLKLSQPWLIGQLLNHYNNATTVSKEESYFYGSLIALTNFLSIIVSHFYQLNIQHLGMKIRIACCSVIYRKVLKIDRRVLAEWNIGRMVNLVTNDVNRFDLAAMHLVQSIVASIESIFVIYCLYETGGTTTIAGIFLLIFFIPVQIYMGRLTTWFRQKTATRTDRRIKLTNEIVSGIEVIKSFTWEELFTKRIAEARKLEVRQILKTSMIRAMNVSFMLFMNRSGVFLCILAYVLTHGEINAKYVFVISSFYAILRQTLTVYLPFGIQNFSETKVSIERIRNFLMVDETLSNQATKEVVTYIPNEKESLLKNPSDTNEEPKPPGVQMENVSIKWTSSPVLTNINFEASLNELVIITGPVGSGKSTLLHTILNELPLTQGALHVRGTISYTSQEPWLFPGTIRQNILFGSKFDQDKYRRVVSVCQLHEDFLALADGDGTWIGESGALLSGGQKSRVGLARSVYKESDVYLLDDPLSAVDAKVAKRIFQECFIGYLRNKCTILVTHNTNYINGSIDRIYVTEGGTMKKDLTYEKEEYIENDDKQDKVRVEVVPKAKQVSEREGGNRGIISREVYRKYIQAGGNSLVRMVLCLLFISAQVAASGADYFVAFWVNNKIDNNTAIGIYAAIIMAIIAVSIARSLIFFKYSMQASINLHGHMFTTIVKASMDFFRATTTGTILNRFSKDLGIIDETLPAVIMDTIQVALIVLGSTSLIIILNPWMVLPTLAIFTLFYFFKTMFLALSRNLKRFEATARSPIYSHVHSSVQGLSIIRAFNAQTALRKEFDHYQDLHSSAFYMFLTCNRAFGFWLDMNCVFYTGAVITTVMLLETLAGDVGLSITQSINLIGVLQWGIRQWSELENQMISVERVVEYTKIPPEDEKIVEEEIPNEWPIGGQIIFESVTLQYFNNPHLALNDINLRIQPNEKIGIVGRTGAGKSSLISALFRLFKFKGKILIDNIDVTEVPLNVLRSKLSIIPQEPILFNGTLRHNLDPHHEHEDHVLYAVIEQVELKTLGLDHEIAERGSNLSVGQKQLVCLARAILRNNRILIMDEATASVDLRTDFLIQKTIKENFRNCTVLTVAHRLGTVLESDRVLVMDQGRIVEFDRVERLLRNPESLFSQLVRESGK